MARMTTPRLGLIYAPARAITIKASWGRSFKAPNLYQQYMGYQTYLLPGSWYGLPSGNLLLVSGGNTRLTPERARTWQAGVTVEPAAVPGLRVEASYFDVQYRDRVAEPFPGSIANALSNPGNAGLVTFSPSAPALATLVAGSRPPWSTTPVRRSILRASRCWSTTATSISRARPSAGSTCARPGKSRWTIGAHWPSTSPGPGSTATRSCRPASPRPASPA
jgi:hypothetical protein